MDDNARIEEARLAEQIYIDLRRQGFGPHTAARAMDSSARDIASYAALNPQFAAAVGEAVEEAIEVVENSVMQQGQQGDLIAARMVLESHKPETWLKPDRDVTLRLGVAPEIDVPELHARLEAIARMKAIDVESVEVEVEDKSAD